MSAATISEAQIALAKLVGVHLQRDSFDVAAATLLDAVAPAIGYEPAEASTDRQRSFAAALGCDVTQDSKRVASAKIGDVLFEKNQQAIATLDLKPGDRVIRVHQFEFDGELRTLEQQYVISSIQPNGRVFFKGGNGQGAWPTQLRRCA
jgi:hypothetical protein